MASTAIAAPTVDVEPTEREITTVFIALMIVLALAALDQSIVATALPRIVADFGNVQHLSWVVTAYVLTSTTSMPLYGKLSDRFGRKPILYVAIALFLLGSALSGAAQSLLQLIVFRGIQGLGAGGLLPLSQIIIADLVPPAQRGKRQGAIVSVFAVSSILGPMVGGALTDAFTWHSIFYVNIPLGAVALVVVARVLHLPHRARAHRIDFAGATLFTTGIVLLLLVLSLGGSEWPWTSPQVAILALVSFALIAAFIVHSRRAHEPFLPLELFRNRLFVLACIVMALTFMGMLGSSVFFPLFFQNVMGFRPSVSGLLTGPMMIGIVIASFLNGRVLLRSGRYKPAQVGGLILAIVAFSALTWCVHASLSIAVIEPVMLFLGFGLGMVMPNMTIAVQNALPAVHRGLGTATLSFFRSLGGLTGVAVSGALLANFIAAAKLSGNTITPGVYRHAISAVFTGGVVVIALALIVLIFLPELPLGQSRHEPVAE